MASNLIIFGAGASLGVSGSSYFNLNGMLVEKTPPLGNKLFNELCQFNPTGWGAVGGEYPKLFEVDFEAGMQHLAHSGTYDIALLQRAMAAYFFNFQVGKNSIYIKLANKIVRASGWQGTIITLNYERLLMQSLNQVGLNTFCGINPQKTNMIELCFPHGCCDIVYDSLKATNGLSFGVGISISGNVKRISNSAEYSAWIKDNSIPPVMSYFEPNKRTLAGINFIDEQRLRYIELASSAKTIAVIGVRFREQDNHIWESLKTTKACIIYCSGKNIAGFTEWQSKYRSKQQDVILPKYFNEAFDEICSNLGLEA